MYEIVVRMRHREEVMDLAASLEEAMAKVQRFASQGYKAHYRAKVR